METDFSPTDCGIVLIAASDRALAETIARVLVETQLAACVTLLPAHSTYTWEGQLQQENQWQLLAKTHLTKFSKLEAKVREIHSDTVPEIIALPVVAGSLPYLQWISESVKA